MKTTIKDLGLLEEFRCTYMFTNIYTILYKLSEVNIYSVNSLGSE